jgi:hypothetical protein
MTTQPDIEIQVFAEDLSTRYLTSPNELHRGEGPWAALPHGDDRCMLAALLTMKSGYKTNKARLRRILPMLGEKAFDNVIARLKDAGFLTTERGHGDGGRFVWTWRAYMNPLPADRRTPSKRGAKKTAGEAIPPPEGYGDELTTGETSDDESAGRTIPPSPQYGEPQYGQPSHGEPRRGEGPPLYKKEQGLELPEIETPPPTPDAPSAQPAEAPAEPGGQGVEDLHRNPEAQRVLESVLDAAGATRGERPLGRSRTRLLDKIQKRIDDGWLQVDLEMELAGSGEGANSIVGVMNARLDDLGAPPPPRPATPAPVQRRPKNVPCPNPGCDSHRGGVGMVESTKQPGRLLICPDCRPDAYAKKPMRMAA